MGRLTEKDDSGNWRLKGLAWKELYAGATLTPQARGKIYGALHKLLDYEETGLSPDEVEEMRESFIPPEEKEAIDRAYADMCRKLEACKKALTEQGASCQQKSRRRSRMVKIQRTRRHGVCNDCRKHMDPDTPIWDVKVSTTSQGWTTVMLCRECMLSLHTALAIVATQR